MSYFVPIEMEMYGKIRRQVFDPDLLRLYVLIRGTQLWKPEEPEYMMCVLQIEGLMHTIKCGSC
jgi:hypothetical protein